MDFAHVIIAKIAIISLFLAAYNLFSCSVHAAFTVTHVLCTQEGTCGITFRYYNDIYEGFVVTNSTPPEFDLYYYPFYPSKHCYSPQGSLFGGFLYMLAALCLSCLLFRKQAVKIITINERTLEVRPDESVSIGYNASTNTLVVITGP